MQTIRPKTATGAAPHVFLSAKIQPPRAGIRTYPCQRLFDQMEMFLEQGHLWIGGAPGAGKTILTTQFLSRNTTPAVWYELDSLDTDPISFFSLFPQAFSFAFPLSPSNFSLPKISPEDMLGLPHFARSFFRQMFSLLPERWLLVLDNFHEIPAESPVLKLLAICLEELPIHCRAILLSRTPPPSLFARMRINGQLQILDPAALRFNRQEIAAIISLHGVDPEEKENLNYFERITSGWAAGLTLLLRGYDRAEKSPDWLDHPDQQELFDYFTEEVFSRFEKRDKDLLLLAAFLPEINTEVLDLLDTEPSCKQFFDTLSRSDFFTYALDSQGQLFHFHPLLKDFLLKKAKGLFSETATLSRLEHLAKILVTKGREEDAIDLLNRAEHPEHSINLMKKVGARLLEQGRFKTLLRWQQALPTDLVNHDPWLLMFFGNAITAFDPPRGVEMLQQSFALFQQQGEKQAALIACSSMTNAIINHFSDLSTLDPWLDFLEKQIHPEMLSTISFENDSIATSIFRAIVLRRPTHPDLEAWQKLVIRQGGMRPSLITHYLWTGRFVDARAAIDNIYAHKERIGSKLQMSAIRAMEVQYYLIMADTDNCVRVIDESLQMMAESGVRVWELHFLVLGAGCCLNCGNREKAAEYLQAVEENIEQARLLEKSYYHVVKTLEALLDDNLSNADCHQETALQMATAIGMPSYTLWCLYGSALVATRRGQTEQAVSLYNQVFSLAANPGNPWFTCQAHLGLAWLYLTQDDRDSAHEHLQKGFSLAARCDYLTFFFFIPQMMETLAVAALEDMIEVDYVQKFIELWNLAPEHPPIHLTNWPWPLKIYTLGRFSVVCHGKKLDTPSLAGGKPIMLLRALIALGGRQVRKTQLVDIFWPDSNGDEQLATLKITLHRLRKLIGIKEAIIQTSNHLSLNPCYCWVDSWQFERLANQALNSNHGEKQGAAKKAFAIYRRAFLSTFQEEIWSLAYRQRLENIFKKLIDLYPQEAADHITDT